MHRSVLFLLVFAASVSPLRANHAFLTMFHEMDVDKDGYVSKDESTGMLRKYFSQSDLNKDGKISEQEVEALITRFQKLVSRFANPKTPTSQQPRLPAGVAWKGNIPYRVGNPRWTLDIAYPTSTTKGKLNPAIVFVHGGGWATGSKSDWYWKTLPVTYAAKGYVCISVNYRLIGEAPFPACIEDVKNSVRWLRANAKEYQVDPNRIGAFGESAGGHLVSLLGLADKDVGLEGEGPYQEYSSKVQAVCAVAPPTDFSEMYVFGFIPGPSETRGQREIRASPITYAHKDAPPFLVIHGTRDKLVDYQQGKAFVDALKKAGAPAELMTFDAGHGVFSSHARQTRPAIESFFAKALK